jgi:hypothetical protein
MGRATLQPGRKGLPSRLVFTGWVLITVCLGSVARADEALTAQQIVDRATEHNAFGFANATATVSLVLQGEGGPARQRQLQIRSREADGARRTLVRFLAPADVAGTSYLVIEGAAQAEAEQYLYLPALNKTKRITGTQREQKFMGTDLTYADLTAADVKGARLRREADGAVGGKPCFVVTATPADPEAWNYGKTVTFIHQESFVPLKVEFFDRAGKLAKTLSVRRLEKRGAHWVATQSLVQDATSGSSTEIRVDTIDFDLPLPESLFTPQALGAG